jgi:predicted dehydrogenase
MSSAPIRLGFIGTGLFVRDVHTPSLLRLADAYQIAALCNQGGDSARQLAESLPGEVAVYHDVGQFLNHAGLDVVSIATPIMTMPALIERALRAGKHVISEKPIAPTFATAQHLCAVYAETARQFPGQRWMVAENWRYEEAFVLAAQLVGEGAIGRPLTFHWALHNAMTPANKYYHTPWRRSGAHPGGFVLDVAVHHVAVLRLILGEVATVSAEVMQFAPDLPPMDTISAVLRMESGVLGNYLFCYAASAPWPPNLMIVGERGNLVVQRGLLELHSQGQKRVIPCRGMSGVEDEFAAFAKTLLQGEPLRNTPQQALNDLAVVEAMLLAADQGETVRLPSRGEAYH